MFALYKDERALVRREGPTSSAHVKWIDFKFLFLYGISVYAGHEILAHKGRAMLEAFPFRVNLAMRDAWLRLARKVEAAHPTGLDTWVQTPAGSDPLLEWIVAQMANPDAHFHAKLSECLVCREG